MSITPDRFFLKSRLVLSECHYRETYDTVAPTQNEGRERTMHYGRDTAVRTHAPHLYSHVLYWLQEQAAYL